MSDDLICYVCGEERKGTVKHVCPQCVEEMQEAHEDKEAADKAENRIILGCLIIAILVLAFGLMMT